jgi:transcription initiation factor TFIID subunit TAF12
MRYTNLTQEAIEGRLQEYSQGALIKALAIYIRNNSNLLDNMLKQVNEKEKKRMEQMKASNGYMCCKDMLLRYYGLFPYDTNNYVMGTRDYAKDIVDRYSEEIINMAEREIKKMYAVDSIRRKTFEYVRREVSGHSDL